jgi:hypothetical protein
MNKNLLFFFHNKSNRARNQLKYYETKQPPALPEKITKATDKFKVAKLAYEQENVALTLDLSGCINNCKVTLKTDYKQVCLFVCVCVCVCLSFFLVFLVVFSRFFCVCAFFFHLFVCFVFVSSLH